MDAMLNGPQGRILLGSVTLAVGRAQDNQLVIHDAKVSAHHAEIRLEKHGHSIVDLGSTNGTFLNEQRLEPDRPYRLKPLDTIRLGGANFIYDVGKAIADAASIPQKNRQGRRVTLAITCGIVLFGVIGFALLAFVVFNVLSGPSSTLNAYCNALKNQNYQVAYQQLDTGSQRKFSLSDFTRYVSDNNGAGRVSGCAVSNVNATDSRGSGTINYTYTSGGTKSIGYTLSSEGDSWHIANVVVSTPDMTLRTYCDALNRRDYSTAYSQFSTGFKSALSEPEFANRFNAAGITSCQASAMQKDGPIAISIITYGDIKGNTIIFNAHLINENGVWKIDTQQA